MKKGFKIGVASLAALMAFGVSGCGKEEAPTVEVEAKYGEVKYTQYGTNYGVRVMVGVKDEKISYIVIAEDDDLVNASAAHGDWTEESRKNWFDNQKEYAQKFVGMKVSDVLAINIAATDGIPSSTQTNVDVVSGATISSARLILAIQAALAE